LNLSHSWESGKDVRGVDGNAGKHLAYLGRKKVNKQAEMVDYHSVGTEKDRTERLERQ
jgi:hypothetical protein